MKLDEKRKALFIIKKPEVEGLSNSKPSQSAIEITAGTRHIPKQTNRPLNEFLPQPKRILTSALFSNEPRQQKNEENNKPEKTDVHFNEDAFNRKEEAVEDNDLESFSENEEDYLEETEEGVNVGLHGLNPISIMSSSSAKIKTVTQENLLKFNKDEAEIATSSLYIAPSKANPFQKPSKEQQKQGSIFSLAYEAIENKEKREEAYLEKKSQYSKSHRNYGF